MEQKIKQRLELEIMVFIIIIMIYSIIQQAKRESDQRMARVIEDKFNTIKHELSQ